MIVLSRQHPRGEIGHLTLGLESHLPRHVHISQRQSCPAPGRTGPHSYFRCAEENIPTVMVHVTSGNKRLGSEMTQGN